MDMIQIITCIPISVGEAPNIQMLSAQALRVLHLYHQHVRSLITDYEKNSKRASVIAHSCRHISVYQRKFTLAGLWKDENDVLYIIPG